MLTFFICIKDDVIDFIRGFTLNITELAWTVTGTTKGDSYNQPNDENAKPLCFGINLTGLKLKKMQLYTMVGVNNAYNGTFYLEFKILNGTKRYMLRISSQGVMENIKDVTDKLSETPLDLSRAMFVFDQLDTLNVNKHGESFDMTSAYW